MEQKKCHVLAKDNIYKCMFVYLLADSWLQKDKDFSHWGYDLNVQTNYAYIFILAKDII